MQTPREPKVKAAFVGKDFGKPFPKAPPKEKHGFVATRKKGEPMEAFAARAKAEAKAKRLKEEKGGTKREELQGIRRVEIIHKREGAPVRRKSTRAVSVGGGIIGFHVERVRA